MNNRKILKTREQKKKEALNAIRKIYHPKYEFPYEKGYYYDEYDDIPSLSEQRERYIANIIQGLEQELMELKVIPDKTKEGL